MPALSYVILQQLDAAFLPSLLVIFSFFPRLHIYFKCQPLIQSTAVLI